MVDRAWDKERLHQLVGEKLGDFLFILVSNREPYVHKFSGKDIICNRPVSGLTVALDPVMRASKGIWVAYGSGSADREVVDKYDHVAVPPEDPEYTLRRVWLSEDEVNGFYLGFSNEGLWPLSHVTFTQPIFRESDWDTYKAVNRTFAKAVIKEIGSRNAVVLVQDYHFALLPRMLKGYNPALTIGQFWHIPWPAREIFRTCPWQKEIIEGLLGNNLIGFHVSDFCHNFMQSAEYGLGAYVDYGKSDVNYEDNITRVKPFPISVDFNQLSEEAGSEAVIEEMERLKREYKLEGKYVGVGMDRMDYTKGIPERLQALGRFFESFPSYRRKVVFIQAGMPSRTKIDSYKNIGNQIDSLIAEINNKYGDNSWQPVIPMTGQLSLVTLSALRRMAHFCVVSSLHDGMNLVAKEYVASRVDEDGVLILSRFAGAAVELSDAILINPYAIGDFTGAIKQAIEMPESERQRRMRNMRHIVSDNNIYTWGGSMVSALISIADKKIR